MGKVDRDYVEDAIESIRMIDEIIRGCTDKNFNLDIYCAHSLIFAVRCIKERLFEVLEENEVLDKE